MKISLIINQEALQVNLQPENDGDRQLFQVLMAYNGSPAQITTGVELSMCRGGYLRAFGRGEGIACITIKKFAPHVPAQ